jgi:hypothetical protein
LVKLGSVGTKDARLRLVQSRLRLVQSGRAVVAEHDGRLRRAGCAGRQTVGLGAATMFVIANALSLSRIDWRFLMSSDQNPQEADDNDLGRRGGGHGHDDDHPDEHGHDHRWLTIFVNAEPKEIDDRELTYHDVLMLEYNGHPPTGDNWYIQVSYSRGPEENPQGTLTRGHSVKTKEGMAFRVRATDRS